MTNIVPLDSQKHKTLKIKQGHGAEFGENIHFVPVVAQELTELAKEYVVCFLKDEETGRFGLYALLGLEPGQNKYLQGERWLSRYIPLHFKRQPFLLPVNQKQVFVDMDSVRVCRAEQPGVAVFTDQAEPSEYLQKVVEHLKRLAEGRLQTDAMIDKLISLSLIEENQISFTNAQGEKKTYQGLYRISSEKLQQLSADDVCQLNQNGCLEACYLLKWSLNNIARLLVNE